MHPEIIQAWINGCAADAAVIHHLQTRKRRQDEISVQQYLHLPLTKRARALQPRQANCQTTIEPAPQLRRTISSMPNPRSVGSQGNQKGRQHGEADVPARRLRSQKEPKETPPLRHANERHAGLRMEPPVTAACPSESYAQAIRQHPSAVSSRPSSPSKKSSKIGDMQDFKDPIRVVTIDTLPEDCRSLMRDMRNISRGFGVLPRLSEQTHQDDDPDESFLRSPAFYDNSSRLSHSLDWDRIHALQEESERHRSGSYHEGSWNTHVQAPILQLAREVLKDKASLRSTRFENLTAVSIVPAEMQPEKRDGSRDVRKIDFAITVDDDLIASTLKARGVCAAPTDYTALNWSPLCVLIETKSGSAESVRQLSVWAFAVFKQIREILGTCPDILPLLSVAGDKWSVLFARQEVMAHGSGEDELRYTTMIHESIPLGSSSEASGILQILSALAVLYEWAGSTHHQWWRTQLVATVS